MVFLANSNALPFRGVRGAVFHPECTEPAVCWTPGRALEQQHCDPHVRIHLNTTHKRRVTQCLKGSRLWTDRACFRAAEIICLFGLWFLGMGQKKKKRGCGGNLIINAV